MMPEQSNDYRIVVLGSAGVGKTSCVLRFVKGQFRDSYIPTVEDTYRQVVNCNKQITTLQITDTTGTHSFPAMQRLSIQKGHAFMLLYSITSKQTLEDLKPIYQQIREIKGEQSQSPQDVPIMLIGCKSDDTACREVSENIGKFLAQHWQCAFIETSAKQNSNIREAFQELLKLDKKRQFNFNVDQDGHIIETTATNNDNSSISPVKTTGGGGAISNTSTTTSSRSPSVTEASGTTRPTTPILNNRTINVNKKISHTPDNITDELARKKSAKKVLSISSTNTSKRKCSIM
ncbi:unnamed protein product [Didymodactylos carnosus]|uniref:Uncharacterized protein n=1 Tax=Didymodactylos carnosus TaxID=1234261 RepID=A0A813YLD2_9BILA|nr:unnamed protein product [Didymodactylos carnosus]CAF0885946.1 unnamed protein product [Didymodactylos carnosus]CAF3642292.1 unnamed protein product [Didymodactylos carnosus]CAF3671083.1 unnamed protein product [Didymodactylos carnosus]